MSKWSPDIYDKAWQFATIAHKDQAYGNGKTYINHIGSVAMEVISALQTTSQKMDSNLAIQCALLHDTIEDTIFSYEDIKKHFDEKVANGVQALTKDDRLISKKERMSDSLNRIRKQPYEIWMVKMADRISNLQEPPTSWTSSKIITYKQEAMLIYESLKDANNTLANRLLKKIRKYEKHIN